MFRFPQQPTRRLALLSLFPALLVLSYFSLAHSTNEPARLAAPNPEAAVKRSEPASTDMDHDGFPDGAELRTFNERKVSLEDYILQVVSTEASIEDEPEALKALAVAARTCAVKNTDRRLPPSRLSSSHFQMTYPQAIKAPEAQHVLTLLEANRAELLRRVSSAGIQVSFPNMEIVVNETTGDFVGRTGLPPWAAAATKNNQMELQPLSILIQRRILETTLRHELVHVVINSLGGGKTPRWLAEGMAVYFAGEGKMYERYRQNTSTSVEAVEHALGSAKTAPEMRSAYAAAYRVVKELIESEGEHKIWKRATIRH